MFVLLMLTFFFFILYTSFYLAALNSTNAFKIRQDTRITFIFGEISLMFDNILHSVFAVKYWVLSKKLIELQTNKNDPKLEIKANILLYS